MSAGNSFLDYFRGRWRGDINSKDRRRIRYEKNKNTINELQILEGHSDIVRFLGLVDEVRVCSGSDDGTIRVWNRNTGANMMTLVGHSHPITCILLINSKTLVSGSADKTIRIWDLGDGSCVRVLKAHEGSVKCIVSLGPLRFCSGSNDRHLVLWSNKGDKLNTIERQEEENLNCLLPLAGERLITASNSSLLLTYKTDTCTYHKVLAYHRESVRCLVRTGVNSFASASMDGAVILWNAETLSPAKVLFNPNVYKDENKVYIYNVQFLLSLGEKHLMAAIGNGFRIYDYASGECILNVNSAHDSEVKHLICLYDGTRIVSCAADGSIKIWTTKEQFNFRRGKSEGKFSKVKKMDAILLGEMIGHTDAVNQLLACNEVSFASCSNDGLVILWKDGKVESEFRNRMAAIIVQNQMRDSRRRSLDDDYDIGRESFESTPFGSESTPFESPKIARHFDITDDYLVDDSEDNSIDSRDGSCTSISSDTKSSDAKPYSAKSRSLRAPEYIVDYAEALRKEKKYTLTQISEDLHSQGHSESIVNAVLAKLSDSRTLGL